MKYKDLNIGDWFTPKGKSIPYIRVQTDDRELYDLCLGNNALFGECFPLKTNPDCEVDFLNELNIHSPYYINHQYFLDDAPICQFIEMTSTGGKPLLLLKTSLKGQNRFLFLNSDNYSGYLRSNYTSDLRVRTVPNISISFPEKWG